MNGYHHGWLAVWSAMEKDIECASHLCMKDTNMLEPKALATIWISYTNLDYWLPSGHYTHTLCLEMNGCDLDIAKWTPRMKDTSRTEI